TEHLPPDGRQTRIRSLADQLGNQAMAELIAAGRADQDDILAFVTARLLGVAAIQDRELELVHREGAHWREWRAMGDAGLPQSKEGAPARWSEVARAYETAVDAAARGDLERARQLVRAARMVEDRVRDATTDLVRTDDVEEGRVAEPDRLADAVLHASAGPIEVPAETREVIGRILDVTAQMPRMRGKPRSRIPWWARDEDEEEEHEEDG
ncbi:MAG: hypothetical protein AAF211_27425, partial [Myxococcota bacterium]